MAQSAMDRSPPDTAAVVSQLFVLLVRSGR